MIDREFIKMRVVGKFVDAGFKFDSANFNAKIEVFHETLLDYSEEELDAAALEIIKTRTRISGFPVPADMVEHANIAKDALRKKEKPHSFCELCKNTGLLTLYNPEGAGYGFRCGCAIGENFSPKIPRYNKELIYSRGWKTSHQMVHEKAKNQCWYDDACKIKNVQDFKEFCISLYKKNENKENVMSPLMEKLAERRSIQMESQEAEDEEIPSAVPEEKDYVAPF